MAGNIASAIAPVTPALFTFMHFNIAPGWTIRQENSIGLTIACMTALLLAYSLIFLKDLSTDPIFPEIQKKHFPDQIISTNTGTTESKNQKLLTFRDILQNGGLMVFLTYMFVSATEHYQLELITNMIAIMDYNYSIFQYGVIVTISVSICVITYFIQKVITSSFDAYFLSIHNLVWLIIAQTLVSLALWIKSWAPSVVCVITVGSVVLLNYLHGTVAVICVKQILFKLTPSHSASIIDSYRFNCLTAATLIAFFYGKLRFHGQRNRHAIL